MEDPPPDSDLPDPWKVGKEYRKTATIFAVQMTRDFTVETLEGKHTGKAGDWLAKGVQGELWPIKADIFEKTYVELKRHTIPIGVFLDTPTGWLVPIVEQPRPPMSTRNKDGWTVPVQEP